MIGIGILVGLVFLIQGDVRRQEDRGPPHAHGGDRHVAVPPLRAAVRDRLGPAAGGADRRRRARAQGRRRRVIRLPFLLIFAALLFSAGVYGVLARRNAVLVLMSIELMLNAVNVNLVAFSQYLNDLTGPDLRAVRHHRRRRRGRHRPGDRHPDLPQPRDDRRRPGRPDEMVTPRRSMHGVRAVIQSPGSSRRSAVSFFLIFFFGKRTPGKGADIGIAAMSVTLILSIVDAGPVRRRPAPRSRVRSRGFTSARSGWSSA